MRYASTVEKPISFRWFGLAPKGYWEFYSVLQRLTICTLALFELAAMCPFFSTAMPLVLGRLVWILSDPPFFKCLHLRLSEFNFVIIVFGEVILILFFRPSASLTIFSLSASKVGKLWRDSIAQPKFWKLRERLNSNIIVNKSRSIFTSISSYLSSTSKNFGIWLRMFHYFNSFARTIVSFECLKFFIAFHLMLIKFCRL